MTNSELNEIKEAILRVDRRINKSVSQRGLIHVDGKKEFAFGIGREPVLIDTFGTLDEDRWWDRKEYDEGGKIVELSKEFVRQYYRSTGYHSELYSAREKGLPEPEIPPLPPRNGEEDKRPLRDHVREDNRGGKMVIHCVPSSTCVSMKCHRWCSSS